MVFLKFESQRMVFRDLSNFPIFLLRRVHRCSHHRKPIPDISWQSDVYNNISYPSRPLTRLFLVWSLKTTPNADASRRPHRLWRTNPQLLRPLPSRVLQIRVVTRASDFDSSLPFKFPPVLFYFHFIGDRNIAQLMRISIGHQPIKYGFLAIRLLDLIGGSYISGEEIAPSWIGWLGDRLL